MFGDLDSHEGVAVRASVVVSHVEKPDRAVELFNEALDLNPDYLEALERIVKILTSQRSLNQLERSYRKMLHRISLKGTNDL